MKINVLTRCSALFLVSWLLSAPTSAQQKPTSRALSYTRAYGSLERGAFSPDGRFFGATAYSYDTNTRRFLAWDARTAQPFAKWKLRYLTEFAWAPDGRTVAVIAGESQRRGIGYGFSITVRDARSGAVLKTLVPTGKIYSAFISLAWSADGKLLAAGGGDGLARVWNVASGKRVAAFRVGQYVNAVQFSPNGKFLAATSDRYREDQGQLQIWDLARKTQARRVPLPRYINSSLQFSRDGALVVVGNSWDGNNTFFDVPSLRTRRRFRTQPLERDQSAPLTFSHGQQVAFADEESIVIEQAASGRAIARFSAARPSSSNVVVALGFAPGRTLHWATFDAQRDEDGNPFSAVPRLWHARF